MQSVANHFKSLMEVGIHNSVWFRTAPAKLRPTAKIRILGVEERRFGGMMHTAMRPALIAECEMGGEVQRFSLLLDNTASVQQID